MSLSDRSTDGAAPGGPGIPSQSAWLAGPAGLALSVLAVACSPPPTPPAARRCGPAGVATAPHVCWAGDAPSGRPLALLAGVPGGPLDSLVADADVTTFLNDRFEPRLVDPALLSPPGERTLVLDPRGCLLPGGSIEATTPTAWIAAVNAALEAPGPRSPPGLQRPVPGIPAGHPLASPCAGPASGPGAGHTP